MPYMSYLAAVDWSTTGEMLQGVGSVLGPVAVGIAAWVGGNTFKSWRQQKLAERRIDQAERILTATYKVRRGLSHIRNPMMLAHEFDGAETNLKESGQWERVVGGDEARRRLTTKQA